jgi:hypothetical protein
MIYRACVSSVLTRGIGKDRKLLVYDDDDVASCLPVLFEIKAMLMHTGFNVPMSASDGQHSRESGLLSCCLFPFGRCSALAIDLGGWW